jgi:hypothetical protein
MFYPLIQTLATAAPPHPTCRRPPPFSLPYLTYLPPQCGGASHYIREPHAAALGPPPWPPSPCFAIARGATGQSPCGTAASLPMDAALGYEAVPDLTPLVTVILGGGIWSSAMARGCGVAAVPKWTRSGTFKAMLGSWWRVARLWALEVAGQVGPGAGISSCRQCWASKCRGL